MDITQIKYFLEVAKNQHITRSAKNLHVTQPTLTQSIHKLEADLGVPYLFQREEILYLHLMENIYRRKSNR